MQVVWEFPADGRVLLDFSSDGEEDVFSAFSGMFFRIFSSLSVLVFFRMKTCGASRNAERSSAMQW